MKANIPRGYNALTEYQKSNLRKWQEETMKELVINQIDHDEAEMQKVWIGYACAILHESFGFGKDRCLQFIGNWKRMYRDNSRLKDKAEQDEMLKKRLAFFGGDYPTLFIDNLEKAGG